MRRVTVISGALVLLLGGIWAFHALRPYLRFFMQSPLPALPYPPPPSREQWKSMPASERLADLNQRVKPPLEETLLQNGLKLGSPAFIRLFKESAELELWLQGAAGAWKHFRTYRIACFSGELGPKQREGDRQAPEGFYAVTARQLNPASSYHLAFNIGYPNAYDLQHQRTGSLIMVHGDEVSVGCYAMTDRVIEEIYLLVAAALENGQPEVPVHCFPFRFTEERMAKTRGEIWHGFWENLREGCESFDQHLAPPVVRALNSRYHISPGR
jgi:murein L,D-transpeptidase YafK